MKTLKILGTSILALSAMASAPSIAQDVGYVKAPTSENVTVKNPFGLCWRTGYWTPAMATEECDPDLVPKKPAAPAVVPPPAPPRAAPAPAPKPAAAAPKRCDALVTFSTDETFAFDKSVLRPAAMAKLDKDVIGQLAQCSKVELILVSGYTDRLGSQQYNQKLSERRADAVKAYLVKKGVDASKIDTMGMGKTLQIKSCPDGKNRKALIECLAPNRRAVVEIKGLAK